MPSRVNPAFSRARCSAALVISVVASIRLTDANRPVKCSRPGLNLAPRDAADAIGAVQYHKCPAVIAEQPGLAPLPALPLGIAPAMPLVRARGGRAVSQADKPRQIVFDHRAEGHRAIHGSEPTADSNGDSNGSDQRRAAAIGHTPETLASGIQR